MWSGWFLGSICFTNCVPSPVNWHSMIHFSNRKCIYFHGGFSTWAMLDYNRGLRCHHSYSTSSVYPLTVVNGFVLPKHSPWKDTIPIGKSSSNYDFWGPMLVWGSVSLVPKYATRAWMWSQTILIHSQGCRFVPYTFSETSRHRWYQKGSKYWCFTRVWRQIYVALILQLQSGPLFP